MTLTPARIIIHWLSILKRGWQVNILGTTFHFSTNTWMKTWKMVNTVREHSYDTRVVFFSARIFSNFQSARWSVFNFGPMVTQVLISSDAAQYVQRQTLLLKLESAACTGQVQKEDSMFFWECTHIERTPHKALHAHMRARCMPCFDAHSFFSWKGGHQRPAQQTRALRTCKVSRAAGGSQHELCPAPALILCSLFPGTWRA